MAFLFHFRAMALDELIHKVEVLLGHIDLVVVHALHLYRILDRDLSDPEAGAVV